MKVENLKVELNVSGVGVKPDVMNNTNLFINGVQVWPIPYGSPKTYPIKFELGDVIKVCIPSGVLTCTVQGGRVDTETGEAVLQLAGQWEGQAGGLSGGMSGVGSFHITNRDKATVVESSALGNGQVVSYNVYESVRHVAQLATHYTPAQKRRVMEKVFQAIVPASVTDMFLDAVEEIWDCAPDTRMALIVEFNRQREEGHTALEAANMLL